MECCLKVLLQSVFFFCLLLLFSMLSALCAVALCSRIAAMSGAYAALKGISKLF